MVWSEESRRLSRRLQVMADKISPGCSCADIGSDHGYLGLYLYEQGISPRVVLTDISEASLSKAKSAAGAGQFGQDLSFRVGDGLSVLASSEVDCVVIAGMGGHLIRDILEKDLEKTRSFSRFILQPRTAAGPLRRWLLEAGFCFLSEEIVEEGDFLPEIITVAPEGKMKMMEEVDLFELRSLKAEDRQNIDLAAGVREALLDPDPDPDIPLDENSILFSVPLWMLSGDGPVLDFIDRKIESQKSVLDGLSRAKKKDPAALARAGYNLDYLKELRQLRYYIEKREAEERAETE